MAPSGIEVSPCHCCLTVKMLPAIVIVPVRLAPEVFAETEYPTIPFPLPLEPDVTVIQGTLLTAVHEQPEPATRVTLTVLAPAAARNALLLGEIENEHPLETPPWLTVKVCPAAVTVPIRELVLGLFATT